MNNQNVQNLVEYIRKNPNVSSNQLEEAVLKVGYSKEELNQALEIVESSHVGGNFPDQQNITSSGLEVLTSEESKRANNMWLWAILGILIILTFGGIAGLYFINQNKAGTEIISSTPTPISAPTSKDLAKPTKEPSITQPPATGLQTNPMDDFLAALSSANYKVSTSGKIEYKKHEEGLTQSSSLDLNNGIIYIQESSVVRLDKTDPERPEIAIIKDDQALVLNPTKKTYTAFNVEDELGKFYITTVKASFPLISLGDDTQEGTVSWQKITDNEWQADWKWKTPLDIQETPVKVRIILDSTTKLINILSFRFDNNQSWQDAAFKYETISDIESLLTISSDYKEEKLDF